MENQIIINIPQSEQSQSQKQIQQTQDKNISLVKEVHEKLQEKQYEATLGIGNIFYALVGFIFHNQSESLFKLSIPIILSFSIMMYYTTYSYLTINQYISILKIYEDISQQNVLSFSIDLEINSEVQRKKNFQNTLLEHIKYKNTFCELFGFSVFILHIIYIALCSYSDIQSTLFLAIIFTGYYINIFIFVSLQTPVLIKKILKCIKQNDQKYILSDSKISQDLCCICMDQFKKGQSGQQYSCCNNVFHTECIQSWKQVKSTCPLCRQDI